MIDAAERGQFKALWAIGYDIALTNPNANATLQALRSLDLVVIQDLFLNETARVAGSVFLPACSSFEKDGTFMNSERRIQRVRKVIEPMGQSRPDWQILCHAARAMGSGEHFAFHSQKPAIAGRLLTGSRSRNSRHKKSSESGSKKPAPVFVRVQG